MEKTCSKCNRTLSIDSFWFHPKGLYKKQSHCKDCQKAAKRGRHNPLKRRIGTLKYNYGLTIEQYNEMVCNQKGLCVICGEPPKDGEKLCVDHCHKTKIVRGLLCSLCNKGLGSARDNIQILISMIKYLEKSPVQNTSLDIPVIGFSQN